MAGTLPGVESARRRRFHHAASANAASWIPKSSFRHDQFCPTSSASLRSACYIHEHHLHDEKLRGLAREAKERLDEKLRNQRGKALGQPRVAKHEDHVVVALEGLKRSRSKRLLIGMKLIGWTTSKLWKASEQDECSICLERFKLCQSLTHLPCSHKFHSKCLAPWIASNAHCPCCRISLTLNP